MMRFVLSVHGCVDAWLCMCVCVGGGGGASGCPYGVVVCASGCPYGVLVCAVRFQ